MTRRMTIMVVNAEIKEKWVFSGEHLKHGKWMASNPPAIIPPDCKVLLESEKQSLASFGTEGWITYVSTVKPGNALTITWSKPYQGATSCTVNMTGTDYTAKVEDEDFHDSKSFCSVVIRKNA